MDIKSAEKTFQNVIYGDKSFDQLIDHLAGDSMNSDYHLSLLIGTSDEKKSDAVQKLADATGRDILTVDTNDIITKIESEANENIDFIFKKYDPQIHLLYLKNGGRLCGVYTGYTQSSVKYATPQERYFLKKMQQSGGMFVVALDTLTDADTTIRRAAQSVVNIPPAQSMLKRLLNKLKGVTMHGHQIKTERPEHYGETAGNF